MLSRKVAFIYLIFIVAVCSSFLWLWSCPGIAAEAEKNLPERLITMSAEYPGVRVGQDTDEVSLDLIFTNKGQSPETLKVWIADQPATWEAVIKTYDYAVTGVFVPADDTKTLTFEAVPGDSMKPGTYEFVIKAETKDGRFDLSQTVSIELTAEKSQPGASKELELTTSYPVIRGPSDASFKFSVDVESNLDKDAVFNLSADGPKDWEINFKPAYEDKYISSLRLKANQSKSVDVEVKPAPGAKVGKHPIQLTVASGKAKAEADLSVVLTGTYDLKAGTQSGLLSLEARPGQTSNVSFYIKNTGTAKNSGISFMSFKPENWKVEFSPENIKSLAPGDLQQVEMQITPYEEALVGDYSVSVRIKGQKASDNLEFRTTVKASAAWGWIGIGIIVLVILGLFTLFRRLGRR